MRFYRNFLLSLLLLSSFVFLKAQSWVEMLYDANANFYDIQKEFNSYWSGRKIEGEGKGWMQFKRWESFMEPRVYPSGKLIDAGATWRAFNEQQNNAEIQTKAGGNKYWHPIGPSTLPAYYGGAGRLNCVEFDPLNSSIIYVGSPSGGLWKSADAGSSWTTTTDNLLSIGVSDIAVDYTNTDIIYIATGDGDYNDTYSIGVMKSTDKGITWKQTGLNADNGFSVNNLRVISRLAIHPTNPKILFAATNTGLYRTDNAGSTWRIVSSAGNFKEVEFKPGHPNTVYAVSTKNFFRSTDGGNSFYLNTIKFSTPVLRLAMSVTPADSNYIYILAGSLADGGFAGLYRSTDGGVTFTQRSVSPNILGWESDGSDKGGQASYDLTIAASPTDKETVFTGGINIWKSINGGQSWLLNTSWVPATKYPYVHADIHMLRFINGSGKDIVACSDGGFHRTTDGGKTWSDKSNGLSIAQMYRFSISQTDPEFMISGWQDNGGNLYYKNKWFHILGGDCMESAIDQKDNSIIYISMYNGKIQRSLTNGVDWAFITEDIIKTEQGAWVTPYMLDAVNPDIIYAGFYNVWKSPNKGNTWTKISNFSSTQSLQSIAVAPSNSKYIYAATFSNIYRTTDGGANWTNITAGLPSTAITYIAVSEKNPDKLWITMSGYVANSKVFMSTDGGKTWINYYIGLPNVPVNCIVYENGFTTDNLYAGTDIGVYYRDSKLKTWIPYMYSLPNVIVNKLEVHYSTKKLRAASYGRGIWEVDLYSSVGIDDIAGRKAFPLKIFPNPANNKINISLSGIQLPANGYQLPATGIRIYNSLGQRIFITDFRPQTSDLVLDISDYPDGIYYVAMLSGNNTYSGSFVKHKE